MFVFFPDVPPLAESSPSKYREAGRLDGKRGIPHRVKPTSCWSASSNQEKFGNQEISQLAEDHIRKLSALQSARKTFFEVYGVDQKSHGDAVQETGQRQSDLDQSRKAYFGFHRKNPTYSGVWPVIWALLFIMLTVSADYPLNLAAFSQLGEKESVTQMMALVFTVILMQVAHAIGALLRSENPAAGWTGRFLAAVSLGFIIALSWMRKGTITQMASKTFVALDPTLMFTFYLCLQALIFVLAVVIGYWMYEPMQHDFNKKTRAVRAGKRAERKAQLKEIATGQAAQTAWAGECNSDHVYIHRDQQLRDRCEELRAIYLRANRAARNDLEDGKLPKAYSKPLNLIRPLALEDALSRINNRRNKATIYLAYPSAPASEKAAGPHQSNPEMAGKSARQVFDDTARYQF